MWGLVMSSLQGMHISPLFPLAKLLGVNIAALNLLFSIAMSYPLAVIYTKYFENKSALVKQLYAIGAGLDIAYFNFGINTYHSMIAIVVFLMTTSVFGPGRNHTIVTLTFNMIYLLLAYYHTESESYDVTWTMPHCVLVLKLIGCSFDIWDGTIPEGKLSEMNKKTALRDIPSVIEMLGFIYFPSAFLVGPQFSMKRYRDLINGKFPTSTAKPTREEAAFKRLSAGVLYLCLFQVGSSMFSQKTLLSEEFEQYSFIYKHIFIGFWGRFVLYKYLACWLLSEASCIRFGIAYNGEEGGQTHWSGSENVKLIRFETTTKFGHYIDSFNVNTNTWVGKYIFRRLKFMGNKYLSQFLSLLFLAVWHGLMSGYYMTFLMEYIIMYFEKDFEPIISKLKIYEKMHASPVTGLIIMMFLKLYTFVFMGFCLIPFDLKLLHKWWKVYKTLYFSGLIIFLPWAFLYKPILLALINKGIIN